VFLEVAVGNAGAGGMVEAAAFRLHRECIIGYTLDSYIEFSCRTKLDPAARACNSKARGKITFVQRTVILI